MSNNKFALSPYLVGDGPPAGNSQFTSQGTQYFDRTNKILWFYAGSDAGWQQLASWSPSVTVGLTYNGTQDLSTTGNLFQLEPFGFKKITTSIPFHRVDGSNVADHPLFAVYRLPTWIPEVSLNYSMTVANVAGDQALRVEWNTQTFSGADSFQFDFSQPSSLVRLIGTDLTWDAPTNHMYTTSGGVFVASLSAVVGL